MSFFPNPMEDPARHIIAVFNGQVQYDGPGNSALISNLNHMFPATGLRIYSSEFGDTQITEEPLYPPKPRPSLSIVK